jgi:hypothetical protein
MKHPKLAITIAICLIAGLVWAFQGATVTMNGKSAPGRLIDGSLYVKLTDVAGAFGQTIVKQGSSYALVPAGGANMLQGTKGKIGEELFTGKWRFLVENVQRADAYMLKFADSKFEYPANPGSELVVIQCRLKNAINETVSVYFNGLANTALTDTKEQVYKPVWMDVAGGVASDMLPGSAKTFAIVFSVPKSAELKDLVYTIEPVSSQFAPTDLRISLKKG